MFLLELVLTSLLLDWWAIKTENLSVGLSEFIHKITLTASIEEHGILPNHAPGINTNS